MNFRIDSRVFFFKKKPETISSSGSFHVPCHLIIVPSSFGKPCRASSPQPDTRNLCSMPVDVFCRSICTDEPTAPFFFFETCTQEVQLLHMANKCFSNTGRLVARIDETNQDTQSFAIPNPRFVGNVPTMNLPSSAEEVCPNNFMVGQPKNHISNMHFEKFHTPSSLQGWEDELRIRSVFWF